ncbi:MAG: 3-phosphoshikimate 1-carboxyvinyltransferase [Halanaerobiaceae bacterium]
MKLKIDTARKIGGEIKVPGDKSISHRSIIFNSIAEGTGLISGFLESEDCLNTVRAFQSMGVTIERTDNGDYRVGGVGLYGLREPDKIIDCGNSGTTMRLLTGLLAAQDFYTVLSGDNSLCQRPMDRIIVPLEKMGAEIWSRQNNYAPLSIKGQNLNGINYRLPVASAQVKSAIILAGLYAGEKVEIIEPGMSRDHTEKMLTGFGVDINKNGNQIILNNCKKIQLKAGEINIPGDISSAAYFIAAALIIPDSELILRNIGINPTRSGFLKIIKNMGADVEIYNKRDCSGEPAADIRVVSSPLEATIIKGDVIPTVIDELPLIALLAAWARGETLIKDAEELRVKESDRIKITVNGLRKLGVYVEEYDDGMLIKGPAELNGGIEIDCFYDHRIAMSFAILGLSIDGGITIKKSEAINTSFPEFPKILDEICSF